MKKVLVIVVLSTIAMLVLAIAGCASNAIDTSNNNQTTASQKWGAGPKITNFYEYQQVMQIYEARDDPKLVLNVYTQANDGSLRCFGKARGYGVPYSTEQSPPTNGTQPVPEPNGLFPSQNTNADWIQLIQPDGSVALTLVEPNMIITPAILHCTPL